MKFLRQLAYIFIICMVGQLVSLLVFGVVPGNVLSMIILFILLVINVIKIESVADVADFLLTNMALLFVPVTVSVFCKYEEYASDIVKLLLLCIITTILTALSAGLTVKYVIRIQNRKKSIKNKDKS